MRDMVAIIGSGMMGSGIGVMAALAGNKTVLMDVDQKRAENGLARAIECIALRTENGLNTAEEAELAALFYQSVRIWRLRLRMQGL